MIDVCMLVKRGVALVVRVDLGRWRSCLGKTNNAKKIFIISNK